MRLTFYLILAVILFNCQDKTKKETKIEVIYAYLEDVLKHEKFELRTNTPPLPPELKENSTKRDSFKEEFQPLQLYINSSILFDDKLQYSNQKSIGVFLSIDDFYKYRKPVFLDLNKIKKEKNIAIKGVTADYFFELYPEIRLNENYGGLLSFKNLFISRNRKRAYFEVNFFKEKLNAGTLAVYAEFKNGLWTFRRKELSVS